MTAFFALGGTGGFSSANQAGIKESDLAEPWIGGITWLYSICIYILYSHVLVRGASRIQYVSTLELLRYYS